MSINHRLDEEILNELDNLERVTIGSDEYKANVDGVTKLLDRKIELEKLENERLDKIEAREADIEIRSKQINESKKERMIDNGVRIATTVFTAGVFMAGLVASTNFEKEGTLLTTEGGRSSLRSLLGMLKLR